MGEDGQFDSEQYGRQNKQQCAACLVDTPQNAARVRVLRGDGWVRAIRYSSYCVPKNGMWFSTREIIQVVYRALAADLAVSAMLRSHSNSIIVMYRSLPLSLVSCCERTLPTI